MANRRTIPRHIQFQVECGPVQYENKAKTIEGTHLLNHQGENNLKDIQKPSQKNHLLINTTSIGMPT